MNSMKNKLVGVALTVGLSGGLNAMENTQGIFSSLTDALFSQKVLAATGILGIGWWIASDDQKNEVGKLGHQTVDFASQNKVPVTVGTLALGAAFYMGNSILVYL